MRKRPSTSGGEQDVKRRRKTAEEDVRVVAKDNRVRLEDLPPELLQLLASKADARGVKSLMQVRRSDRNLFKHWKVWWPIYVRQYGVFGLRAFNVRNPDGTVDEEGSEELETYYRKLAEEQLEFEVLPRSGAWNAAHDAFEKQKLDIHQRLRFLRNLGMEPKLVAQAEEELRAVEIVQRQEESRLKANRLWYWTYQYREKLGASYRGETVGHPPQRLAVRPVFSARPFALEGFGTQEIIHGYGEVFGVAKASLEFMLEEDEDEPEDLEWRVFAEGDSSGLALGWVGENLIPLRRRRILLPEVGNKWTLASWEGTQWQVVYRNLPLHGESETERLLTGPEKMFTSQPRLFYDAENDVVSAVYETNDANMMAVFEPLSLRILWSSIAFQASHQMGLKWRLLTEMFTSYIFLRGELIFLQADALNQGFRIRMWRVWHPGMAPRDTSPAVRGPFFDNSFLYDHPEVSGRPPTYPSLILEFAFWGGFSHGRNLRMDGSRIILPMMSKQIVGGMALPGRLSRLLLWDLNDPLAKPVTVLRHAFLGAEDATTAYIGGGALLLAAPGEMWVADADAFRAAPEDPHVWRRNFLAASFEGNPTPDVAGPFLKLNPEVFSNLTRMISAATGESREALTSRVALGISEGMQFLLDSDPWFVGADGTRLFPSFSRLFEAQGPWGHEEYLIRMHFEAVDATGGRQETQILVGDSVELKKGTVHLLTLEDAGEEPFYVGTSKTGGFGRPGEWRGTLERNGRLELRTDDSTPDLLYYRSAVRSGVGGTIHLF